MEESERFEQGSEYERHKPIFLTRMLKETTIRKLIKVKGDKKVILFCGDINRTAPNKTRKNDD